MNSVSTDHQLHEEFARAAGFAAAQAARREMLARVYQTLLNTFATGTAIQPTDDETKGNVENDNVE